jgi:hypothetical protein
MSIVETTLNGMYHIISRLDEVIVGWRHYEKPISDGMLIDEMGNLSSRSRARLQVDSLSSPDVREQLCLC